MSLEQPKSPSTWAKYAQAPEIKAVPFRDLEYLKKEAKIQVSRAVYLEYPSVVKTGYETARLFAEVISIDKSIVINLQTAAEITLCARVLTSDGDVQLELVPPTDKDKESILSFYADKLDHPLSYTIRGTSHKGTLSWGPDAAANKDKVGVHLYFGHDQGTDNPVVEYLDHYRDAAPAEQFSKSLETQLRVASVLFWAAPSIAASQAAYIAKASAKSSGHELINLQAVNLGEQLAAQALAGPNMNYAPILDMERYEKTADAFIKAAEKYEEQYYRFEDRAQSTEHRLEAWDNMISRVQGLAEMRKDVTETASVKYDEAVKIVQTLHKQVENTKGLEDAQHKLNIGIKTWQNDMKLKAAFQIIKAVMDFALAIGLLCVGAPPVGNPVGEAVEAVEAVEKAGSAILKVSSSTLKTLKDCIDMVEKLYPAITQAADSIKLVESGKMDQVTKISEISGGAATAGSIGAIAAWDKWILQSDDQLKFPISQGINGATDYRLELRKHAIDAKALIQAQVEAIKAGQEYIRARLEQSLAESDLKKLDELKSKWEKDQELEEEAGARFYDRFLTLRVSIVMEMRNMIWAYKYKALEDSKVALSAQKSTADYREDYATILREDNNSLSKYHQSFSINEPQKSQDLPVPYRSQFLENLKKPPYSATFVLVPTPKNTKDEQNLSGPFNEGQHFRIKSLQVVLLGAVPKPGVSDHRHGDFQLRISTSGVYADIRDDKIFNFAMKPITGGLFNYSKNGNDIDVRESSFDQDPLVSKEFAPPTPFTQWTISIKNADQLDLEKLTDVEIHWAGTAFTVPSTRR